MEGHRKFIDIYLMLEGSEQVGWVSTKQLGDLPVYEKLRKTHLLQRWDIRG